MHCAYCHPVMAQWAESVAVLKTFSSPRMGCLASPTVPRACSCVRTRTNASPSGGSAMDRMTAVTNQMNPKLVPSLNARRANSSAGTRSACILHRYVTGRITAGTPATRRTATNMNVLKTNLNVQQMGQIMHFAFHLTGNATKFTTVLEARTK